MLHHGAPNSSQLRGWWCLFPECGDSTFCSQEATSWGALWACASIWMGWGLSSLGMSGWEELICMRLSNNDNHPGLFHSRWAWIIYFATWENSGWLKHVHLEIIQYSDKWYLRFWLRANDTKVSEVFPFNSMCSFRKHHIVFTSSKLRERFSRFSSPTFAIRPSVCHPVWHHLPWQRERVQLPSVTTQKTRLSLHDPIRNVPWTVEKHWSLSSPSNSPTSQCRTAPNTSGHKNSLLFLEQQTGSPWQITGRSETVNPQKYQ